MSAGPRFLDVAQISKVQTQTVERYKKALQPLVTWLSDNSYLPENAEQMDDLIVEFKYEHPDCTRAQYEQLLAAVEFVFPRYKGKLGWSHSISKGWAVSHIPKHAVPQGKGLTALLAIHFAAMGYSRLGIGMMVQQQYGMRPSEMLGLRGSDILLGIAENVLHKISTVTLKLGKDVGTKAKREQYVIVRESDNISLFHLLLEVRSSTLAEAFIFPHTYNVYRRLLNQADARVGVSFGLTPHSPRAGFASEGIAAGRPFLELKEVGRWVSEQSFRIYVDIITAHNISNQLKSTGLGPAIREALVHLALYFPAASFNQGIYATKGSSVGPEISVVAACELNSSQSGHPSRQEAPGPQTAGDGSRGGARGGGHRGRGRTSTGRSASSYEQHQAAQGSSAHRGAEVGPLSSGAKVGPPSRGSAAVAAGRQIQLDAVVHTAEGNDRSRGYRGRGSPHYR
ncbi:unnamed protein product [Polarella glacialis]|uniref:Tyr recombinase domain-containing protein n=1 Tax=Polarella glacialis TaxID=89957 RepID=A0A813I9K6_POLGL|nr:unnamed protein product [Polarella glacialis]